MVRPNFILHSLLVFLASICRNTNARIIKHQKEKILGAIYSRSFMTKRSSQSCGKRSRNIFVVRLGLVKLSGSCLLSLWAQGPRQCLSRHPLEGHLSCSSRHPSLSAHCISIGATLARSVSLSMEHHITPQQTKSRSQGSISLTFVSKIEFSLFKCLLQFQVCLSCLPSAENSQAEGKKGVCVCVCVWINSTGQQFLASQKQSVFNRSHFWECKGKRAWRSWDGGRCFPLATVELVGPVGCTSKMGFSWGPHSFPAIPYNFAGRKHTSAVPQNPCTVGSMLKCALVARS